jgi:hypothetical protein
MRITRRALALSFPFLLAACKGTENVAGTPSGQLEQRTIDGMKPYIRSSLTPKSAENQFGIPNSRTTAGEIVMIYNVEDSKKVSLGFPSQTGLIIFARVSDKTGASQDLPILP